MKSALLGGAMAIAAVLATPFTFAGVKEESKAASIEQLEAELGVDLIPVQQLMGSGVDTCPQCYIVFGNTIYYIHGCDCA